MGKQGSPVPPRCTPQRWDRLFMRGFRCKFMVECHLLGSGRALLARERRKVERNPREMGCACAWTSNSPETLPQAAATARLAHLAAQHDLCKMLHGNVPWLPTTPKPPGRIPGEGIQAKIRLGTILVVWMYQQQPVPGDIPWQ